jgi:hypothetical protein
MYMVRSWVICILYLVSGGLWHASSSIIVVQVYVSLGLVATAATLVVFPLRRRLVRGGSNPAVKLWERA